MPKGHTMSALLEGELNSATKEEVPSPVALSAPENSVSRLQPQQLGKKTGAVVARRNQYLGVALAHYSALLRRQ
jgi:hypothetical protein